MIARLYIIIRQVFFILLLTNSFFVYAEIIQSKEFSIISDYLSNQTLLILDIDNTVAEPAQGLLGSDQWFCQMMAAKQKNNTLSFSDALNEVLPLYNSIQMNIWLKPVEDYIPILIKSWQAKGIQIIALTARNFKLVDTTISQLKKINIDLTFSKISDKEISLSLAYPCHYKNGIIFCGQNDKGDTLKSFFEYLNYYPKKVIFIDDKEKYLIAVEKVMKELKIPFIGIRYGHLDEKINTFNNEQASLELNLFLATHPQLKTISKNK